LQSQKGTVVRALERLERRTAEVIYGEQKWYNRVGECQDDEERAVWAMIRFLSIRIDY
jgi:hypothetical protein